MKYSNAVKSTLSAAALGFLALGLASTSAFATTTVTAPLTVTASVTTSCNITPAALSFGTYSGAALPVQTSIAVTCNAASVPYNIGLNTGLHGSGSYTRNMENATSVNLNYGLYRDAGLSSNWGTTSGTDTFSSDSTATPSVPVYGVIPMGQVVTTTGGTSFSDTITASIYF